MRRYLLLFVLSALAAALPTFYCYGPSLADPQFDEMMTRVHREPVPILMLGDSSVGITFDSDTERLGIDAFIARDLGEPILAVTFPAFSTLIYQHYLDHLASAPNKPKVVIFPINLRTWSPAWGDRPAYQFASRTGYVDRRRGVLNLAAFAAVLNEQSLNDTWNEQKVVTVAGETLGTNRELTVGPGRDRSCGPVRPGSVVCRTLAQWFWWHYGSVASHAAAIDRSLSETISKARSAGIELVIYLTPVNVEGAKAIDGRLASAIEERAAAVRRLIAREGETVLDLHDAMPSERFHDWGCVCEHLDEIGRKFVAEQVAAAVRTKLQKSLSQAGCTDPKLGPRLRQATGFDDVRARLGGRDRHEGPFPGHLQRQAVLGAS